MVEKFNLTLDINEKVNNLDDLKRSIMEIKNIESVDKIKTAGIGLCLLIVVVAPLIAEVIIHKAAPAIKKLKKRLKEVLEKSKISSDKGKVTIQYKALNISMKNEKEIDLGVDRLVNYD
ncbi:MAG: hypothetical protein ACFFD2_16165 [Promethearchaeota archaeon]